MASIMKRGNTYSVRYNYKDHAGKPCKGWETFKTKAEAQERKITVEKELLDGTFLVPDAMTVEEMLYKWIPIQSSKHKWSPKTYTQSVAMVQNLIVPYIGKRKAVTGSTSAELRDPFRKLNCFGRLPVHDSEHRCNCREKVVEIVGARPVCFITLSSELRVRHLPLSPRQIIFSRLLYLAFSGKTVVTPVPVVEGITVLRICQRRISKRIFHHKRFPFHSNF